MRQYSRRISPHFYEHEFACKCCGQIGDKKQLMILVARLEMLRSKFNKPVKVISGYRCSNHNNKVDGAKKSQHMLTQAADIMVDGISPQKIAKLAHGIFNGIGVYDSFTHVDTRAIRASWDGTTKKDKEDVSDKKDTKPSAERSVPKVKESIKDAKDTKEERKTSRSTKVSGKESKKEKG